MKRLDMSVVSPHSERAERASEFAAFARDCAVYSLASRAKIGLRGGDRVRWLNGMVTNNVRDLAADSGVYAFLLNPQGHIHGDLYAYNRGESLVVDVEKSEMEKLLGVFDHYIIMDDVELTLLPDIAALGVAGPEARAPLAKLGITVPELEPLQLVETSWNQVPVTLVRGDNPAVATFELWIHPAEVDKLTQALRTAGGTPVSADAVELLRIASGIPRYGQDIRERDLPQETEQDRALNFNKGCYIGQEIVERIRSRGNVHRKFTGFEIHGALPAPGAKIQVDGKDAGEITSVASLPLGGSLRPVALGYIRREWAIPGKSVRAGESDATVAALPFHNIF